MFFIDLRQKFHKEEKFQEIRKKKKTTNMFFTFPELSAQLALKTKKIFSLLLECDQSERMIRKYYFIKELLPIWYSHNYYILIKNILFHIFSYCFANSLKLWVQKYYTPKSKIKLFYLFIHILLTFYYNLFKFKICEIISKFTKLIITSKTSKR